MTDLTDRFKFDIPEWNADWQKWQQKFRALIQNIDATIFGTMESGRPVFKSLPQSRIYDNAGTWQLELDADAVFVSRTYSTDVTVDGSVVLPLAVGDMIGAVMTPGAVGPQETVFEVYSGGVEIAPEIQIFGYVDASYGITWFNGVKLEAGAGWSVLFQTQEDTYKTKYNAVDNAADYLDDKVRAGSNITITPVDVGGKKHMEISASGGAITDELVKVSATDTTAGYLEQKIVAGANITLNKLNSPGDEDLEIVAADNSVFEDGAGANATKRKLDSSTAAGDGAFAHGPSSAATGDYSTAIGQGAIAVGNNSIALGADNSDAPSETDVNGVGGLATGGGKVTATNAFAHGNDCEANGTYSQAIGLRSVAGASLSSAVGDNCTISEDSGSAYSAARGRYARVYKNRSSYADGYFNSIGYGWISDGTLNLSFLNYGGGFMTVQFPANAGPVPGGSGSDSIIGAEIKISGTASNDGQFVIAAVTGDYTIKYVNGSGANETGPVSSYAEIVQPFNSGYAEITGSNSAITGSLYGKARGYLNAVVNADYGSASGQRSINRGWYGAHVHAIGPMQSSHAEVYGSNQLVSRVMHQTRYGAVTPVLLSMGLSVVNRQFALRRTKSYGIRTTVIAKQRNIIGVPYMKHWELHTSLQTDYDDFYPKGTVLNRVTTVIGQSSQSSEASWRAAVATAQRVQCNNVISDALSAPPVSPTTGDAYILGSSPSGAWSAGSQGDLYQWTGSAWVLVLAGSGTEPADGCKIAVKATGAAGSFVGQENYIATYDATGNVWSFEHMDDAVCIGIVGNNALLQRSIQGFDYQSGPPEWTPMYYVDSVDEVGTYLYVLVHGANLDLLWGANSEITEVGDI